MPTQFGGRLTGTGNPNSVVSAPAGTIYQDMTPNLGKLYLNVTGGTTWVQLPTTAGGMVNSVTAGNGTVVVAGTATDPTVAVGTGIPESSITNLVADLAAKSPVASPTFTGITTAPEFSASGLTGATQASRYVGATASGAPVSGTFAIGDHIIDRTGKLYICTTAGTPGTWTQVGGGGSTQSNFGTLTDTTPNSLTYVAYGSETVTVTSPPAAAVVMATLTYRLSPGPAGTVGDRGSAKLQASFDGGSTFADLSTGLAFFLASTTGGRGSAGIEQGRLTGAATGNIVVKALCADTDTANHTSFVGGRLLVIVHPQ